MNRRVLVIIGAIAAVFVIGVVGASTINFSGSDSAPAEGKTVATCVSDLVVRTPVDTSDNTASKVKQMKILGDLSDCVGQTLRADLALDSGGHVYAIYEITSPLTELTLNFDATTGDFFDAKPIASNGELIASGSRVAPIAVSDFGLTTVTIAKTWE